MSKRKVSVPERSTRKPTELNKSQNVIRFVGVSLAGGKSDKACIAVIEYYENNNKLFLSRLFEKIKSDEQISADLKIHELILQNEESTKYVAYDIPFELPLCLSCKLKCPGFENCREPHIEWMWRHQTEKIKKKKPRKLFTPYTQRCVELYFQTELEHVFQLHHAMGSNSAPLLARALFIQRRLKLNSIEVFPKLSFWRLGEVLGLMKSQLKSHRAAFGGDEARAHFINKINEQKLAFIYNQDAKMMIENGHAFDAFLCAYTAFLKFKKLTQSKPSDFPANEGWIEFPKKQLKIKELLLG